MKNNWGLRQSIKLAKVYQTGTTVIGTQQYTTGWPRLTHGLAQTDGVPVWPD